MSFFYLSDFPVRRVFKSIKEIKERNFIKTLSQVYDEAAL